MSGENSHCLFGVKKNDNYLVRNKKTPVVGEEIKKIAVVWVQMKNQSLSGEKEIRLLSSRK